MTFEEWWAKEGVTKQDEADCGYFSKNNMMWISELAWKAAIETMRSYKTQPNKPCSTCGESEFHSPFCSAGHGIVNYD